MSSRRALFRYPRARGGVRERVGGRRRRVGARVPPQGRAARACARRPRRRWCSIRWCRAGTRWFRTGGFTPSGSPQARWNRCIDRWTSLGLADIVLCDTWAHGELFERSVHARAAAARAGRRGAALLRYRRRARASPVRIVYVGGFLPLHGMRDRDRSRGAARARSARAAGVQDRAGRRGHRVRPRARAGRRRSAFARDVRRGRRPYAEAPRSWCPARTSCSARSGPPTRPAA